MSLWDTIKKDVEKGIKEGMEAVREGATVVRKKAEKLTKDAKKRYAIIDLKVKIQKELLELGGTVYDLSSKGKDPMENRKVRSMIEKVKKMETRMDRLEGKPGKKKTVRPKTRKAESRKV